ncbi:MAG: pilus assembly protein [Rhizobiaceae bacterium]|nr:pilus assembly protein [Rhizobiaceae bacterium]
MTIIKKLFCASQKLRTDDKGVTALEFAILGPVYFAMLLGILEIGYTFLKVNMLNNAVAIVSKEIYTGAASNGTVSYEDIENSICENIYFSGSDCTSNLQIEVTEVTSLQALPTTGAECADTNVALNPSVDYNPGSAKSIIFLRACYLTDILTPGLALGLHLNKTNDNKYAIIGSTAFVNEPF